jgi:hypothetical protein
LIARSAEVALLDEEGPAIPAAPPYDLPSQQVISAIEELVSAFPQIVAGLDPPLSPAQISELEKRWTSAVREMLRRLAIRP